MEKIKTETYQVTLNRSPETGRVTHEFWEVAQDHCYCPHGPAIRRWDEDTGALVEEVWHNKEGQVHRSGDEPARISYNPYTGDVVSVAYFINGKKHRLFEGAPAQIDWDPYTGKLECEQWYQHGELHRNNGQPAMITRCPQNDVITQEHYYYEGKLIDLIERNPRTGQQRGTKEAKTSPSPDIT